MHIALCDDNVADRKQFERLIGREIDKWIKKEEPVYSYTFGSLSALFRNGIEISGLFIDITETEGEDVFSAIKKVRENGWRSIIFVCSKEDHEEALKAYEEYGPIRFIRKPIQPIDLASALEYAAANNPVDLSKIEIRTDSKTYYLKDEDILYARKKGEYTEVFLSNGEVLDIKVSIHTFYDEISSVHDDFIQVSGETVVNKTKIKEIKTFSVIMNNGETLKISLGVRRYLKENSKTV